MVPAIYDGTNQEVVAEVVFVVDMPYLAVVRMVEQQRTYDGVSALARQFRLLDNIRYEFVTQFPPALDNRCNGRIVPRLTLAGSVVTHVAGEYTELCPAYIDLLVQGGVHEVGNAVEPRHVVAPESKARKPKVQSAFQRTSQTIP